MAAAFGRLALQLLPSLFGNGAYDENFVTAEERRRRQLKREQDAYNAEMAGKTKASGRHHIVKQVMLERGVSLPQASSIVKREGLYVPTFGKGRVNIGPGVSARERQKAATERARIHRVEI
jgi:hypothetical protein